MDRQEQAGGQSPQLIHLIKLAVGSTDLAALARWQEERQRLAPPLRHRTRNRPKRAAELCAGGSIYWVVAGVLAVRQRVIGVIEDHWDDGAACAGIVLDPTLVRVAPRPVKAFQGWRYLRAEDAPADLDDAAAGGDELPASLRLALARLALL